MNQTPKILCTLGPASLNERVIRRLTALGVGLFRINLSHTALEELAGLIRYVRRFTDVPVCLDTEGAQVRTGALGPQGMGLRANTVVTAHRNRDQADPSELSFYPAEAFDALRAGDFITIDFNAVLVRVIEKHSDRVLLKVLNGGRVDANRAVTVERDLPLPVLTQKDVHAIALAMKEGVRHVALSFAHREADVDQLRSLCDSGVFIISKIECRKGLKNMDAIALSSEALLIDRGDLSREEPIERIPKLQKTMIRRAKALGKPVYVATNLLESMVNSDKPTRAEVNDVINTLMDGADGLVLAAETAIGKNPVGCTHMIVRLIHEFAKGNDREAIDKDHDDALSFLVEPHGGSLAASPLVSSEHKRFEGCRHVRASYLSRLDAEEIAVGTFSPLRGFMDREALSSVLNRFRLPGGLVWTMPVVLQLKRDQVKGLSRGERLVLTDESDRIHSVVDVSEVYTYDMEQLVRQWFGTSSHEHPGVRRVREGGEILVAGEVTPVQRMEFSLAKYRFTPAESRFIFARKGWSRVVGFHTRNVVHRAHEYIQMKALEKTHADGLYISPVIGSQRDGDFLPEAVIRSYQLMIDSGLYPPEKVVLGCFATYPRYAGPREAIFTALCRKNMGCSHFIVGRNHAGVGDFYSEADYRRLFEDLGDLGIEPVFFDEVGYHPSRKSYHSRQEVADLRTISGSEMRRALLENLILPDWFVRDQVHAMLRTDLNAKRPVFVSDP